jgi:hypothetical protein
MLPIRIFPRGRSESAPTHDRRVRPRIASFVDAGKGVLMFDLAAIAVAAACLLFPFLLIYLFDRV